MTTPVKAIGCSLKNPPAGAFKLEVFIKPTDPADGDSPLWPIVGIHTDRGGIVAPFTFVFGLPCWLPDDVRAKMTKDCLRASTNAMDAVRLANHTIEDVFVDVEENSTRLLMVSAIVKHTIGSRVFYTHERVPLTNDDHMMPGTWAFTPWSLKAAALKAESERVRAMSPQRRAHKVPAAAVTAAYNSALRVENAHEFVKQLVNLKRSEEAEAAAIAAAVPVAELDKDAFARAFSRRVRR